MFGKKGIKNKDIEKVKSLLNRFLKPVLKFVLQMVLGSVIILSAYQFLKPQLPSLTNEFNNSSIKVEQSLEAQYYDSVSEECEYINKVPLSENEKKLLNSIFGDKLDVEAIQKVYYKAKAGSEYKDSNSFILHSNERKVNLIFFNLDNPDRDLDGNVVTNFTDAEDLCDFEQDLEEGYNIASYEFAILVHEATHLSQEVDNKREKFPPNYDLGKIFYNMNRLTSESEATLMQNYAEIFLYPNKSPKEISPTCRDTFWNPICFDKKDRGYVTEQFKKVLLTRVQQEYPNAPETPQGWRGMDYNS